MNDISIRDLIELLEEAAEEVGANAPVRVAIQPGHPLRLRLAGVSVNEGEAYVVATDNHPTNGSPYADKDLWKNLI